MPGIKEQIKNAIQEQGVIAIIRGVSEKDICPLLDALICGGVKVSEITFGYFSDEETERIIQKAVDYAKDKIYVGAGTVTCVNRARIAICAGADFMVAPNFSEKVINYCNQEDKLIISGAFTPTEIINAHQAGADFVKIFPANLVGAQYFKNINALNYNIPLIAFAGITSENIAEYIKAGAVGAGVGSEFINLKQIQNGNFAYVTEKAQELLSAVKAVK